MQILDEVPMIWGSCFMVYTMQGVLTLFFNLLWILSSSICNLTKTISRRQYQAGSQGNILRRERRTLRIMFWQFSFCFTASSLPWSTSSCLIPPSSWWPPCIVFDNFRPNPSFLFPNLHCMVLGWMNIFFKVMYALVVVGSVWQALSLLRSHYSPLGARWNISKVQNNLK